jgi:hypothetical protein
MMICFDWIFLKALAVGPDGGDKDVPSRQLVLPTAECNVHPFHRKLVFTITLIG